MKLVKLLEQFDLINCVILFFIKMYFFTKIFSQTKCMYVGNLSVLKGSLQQTAIFVINEQWKSLAVSQMGVLSILF